MMVVCPICNSHLEGAGENELSLRLQEHFASIHGFKDMCRLEEHPVTGEGAACIRATGGDLADLSYGQRGALEAHRPEGQTFPGEDVMETVRCPICGRTITGHAFDDLSYQLSRHLSYDHLIKVSVLGKG